MYTGKTLFAQIMDFLPWKTFHRLVSRYDGDHGVRTLPSADHFRVLALAQLTYRESLRDFEHRLIAQARGLYAEEDLGLDLSNTVYALDSTTIDLCLSLFPWAPFRSTKAAIKMHTLQRSQDRENARLSDQPVWSSGNDHLRVVQSPLAGGVVFQMDHATSAHQKVL